MMEVPNPASALPTTLGHGGETDFAPPPVLSLEEFLKAAQQNEEASPASTPTIEPTLAPKPVSTRTSKYTILLHEKFQYYDLDAPDFVYRGTSSGGWAGTLEYLGEMHEEAGPLPSKQHVKEALSEKAVRTIERKEEDGELVKPFKRNKRKKKGGEAGAEANAGPIKDEPFVNYTGQLLGKCLSHESFTPTPSIQIFRVMIL